MTQKQTYKDIQQLKNYALREMKKHEDVGNHGIAVYYEGVVHGIEQVLRLLKESK